jgi:alkaline phosphatase
MGYATGIVTTTRVTHATPAAFTAHVPDRNSEYEIAKQQILTTKPDLIFGGGKRFFQNRPDNLNLLTEAKTNGYTLLEDYPSFAAFNSWKLPLFGSKKKFFCDLKFFRNFRK